jgi:hypothetical protein
MADYASANPPYALLFPVFMAALTHASAPPWPQKREDALFLIPHLYAGLSGE